ncbi:MAG: serine hydrolase, partial [Myxococcota bacterium]
MRVLGHAFAFVIVGSGAAAFGAEFEPPKSPQELEKQILAGDAVLFEQGFNRCDLGALRNIMHPDVVMIHDQSGTNRGIEDFIRPVKQNICNGSPKKPLRTLDPGTTKIFPLYNNGKLYGALQSGKHSFFIKEGKNEPYLTNRARFFTEWRLTTSGWKMKTAYSFQHMNPTENPEMDADVLDGGFDGYGTTRFMLDAHKVRGQAVAILRRGKVTEVRAFGDRSATEPVAVDTRFNVASLAKPVTALTVLRLVSAGQWDLDEPLARYYVDPELRSVPAAR